MFARGLARFAPLLLALPIGNCAPLPPPPPIPPASVSLPIVPLLPPPDVAPAPPQVLSPPPAPLRRNAADLRAEFGAPDFVRKETDSELWRYDGANCALFALLYRQNEDYLVRHIETLPAGNGSATDEVCVSSVKARVAPPS